MNLENVQLSVNASSQKVIQEGSGSFEVPALPGSGSTYGVATIPHPYGSNELIAEVQASTNVAGTNASVMPWASPDGRLTQYTSVDDTNLYIYCVSKDSSGFGAAARTVTYTYRLIAP